MRSELQTHPKIVRILSATQSDRFRVIGGLHAVWAVFDTHSVDGELFGYTPDQMDQIIGWQGFTAALVAVGWMQFDGVQTLVLPEFDEHNSKNAKRRAEDQKRKRDERKGPQPVHDQCGQNADKNGTREREESKQEKESTPPTLPSTANPSRGSKTFKTWLAELRESGEKPIPEGDTVFEYAETACLPVEYLHMAWEEFKARYLHEDKRYKDWRSVFRKAVRGDWFSLWRNDGSGYVLTSKGNQAMLVLKNKQKEAA
jgi:hypothetical protein